MINLKSGGKDLPEDYDQESGWSKEILYLDFVRVPTYDESLKPDIKSILGKDILSINVKIYGVKNVKTDQVIIHKVVFIGRELSNSKNHRLLERLLIESDFDITTWFTDIGAEYVLNFFRENVFSRPDNRRKT